MLAQLAEADAGEPAVAIPGGNGRIMCAQADHGLMHRLMHHAAA